MTPRARRWTDDYERLIRGEVRSLAERQSGAATWWPLSPRVASAHGGGLCAEERNTSTTTYPAGVENVAYDSLDGLNSPVFIRTVKLKDYPWNGKLHLGVRDPRRGRLEPGCRLHRRHGPADLVGHRRPGHDLRFPFNASWMPNRVQSEVTRRSASPAASRCRPTRSAQRPAAGRCSASVSGRSPRRR